jgi:hypothetical protein
MVSVIINGFQNDTEAQEFISWYEGQGEQDSCIWFELRQEEGKKVRDSIICNLEKTYVKGKPRKDVNGNWVLDVSN